jgi:hypothetical protein
MLRRMVLIGLVAVSGCDASASGPSSGLTDREFIELYVALRDAQNRATSPEEFERVKQNILAEAGAKPESMQQFVREHRTDIKRLAAVWDSIRIRVDQSPAGPR